MALDGQTMLLCNGVSVTKLPRVKNVKGDILHVLKSSDDEYKGFGEAYFTTINHNDIKGWKEHKEMVLNLVVPVGGVRFYFFDRETKNSVSYQISEVNYERITVAPNVIMAFEGLMPGVNLILNVASIKHDPAEAINHDIGCFPLTKIVNK